MTIGYYKIQHKILIRVDLTSFGSEVPLPSRRLILERYLYIYIHIHMHTYIYIHIFCGGCGNSSCRRKNGRRNAWDSRNMISTTLFVVTTPGQFWKRRSQSAYMAFFARSDCSTISKSDDFETRDVTWQILAKSWWKEASLGRPMCKHDLRWFCSDCLASSCDWLIKNFKPVRARIARRLLTNSRRGGILLSGHLESLPTFTCRRAYFEWSRRLRTL